MKDAPFLNLVLAVVLMIAIGWLMFVGRGIVLPVFAGAIVAYVLLAATDDLARLPGFRRLPKLLIRLVLLLAFSAVLIAIAIVVAATVQDIVDATPTYQTNLNGWVDQIADAFEVDSYAVWDEIRAVTIDQINMQRLALSVLGGFTSLGVTVFLIVIYAAFLLAERQTFVEKLRVALHDRESADRSIRIIAEINQRISRYLAVKTFINVLLAILSYAALRAFSIDFALFWALMIGLFNYIPYVGSYIGVAFPVMLSLVQYTDIWFSVMLTLCLTVAQVLMGNIIEPRIIGRQLNLSPFVVIVALSFWATIWGIPGAILAVPMTSILAIILSSFSATRPIAVMMAERIDDPDALVAGAPAGAAPADRA
ncbi:AI-2E family transporter [Pseudooceanicola sp. LIPI14-2-Ac024]|uniref:AI-2E family transporter n=1 Tax=Pseudooceanicola sp. LIPI14-2-Ac024 TaxID=3344875 RepID=UPI0035CF6919